MNLNQAAQLALKYIEQNAIISGIPIRDALRAALAEESMQRLTDVQQNMEGEKLSHPSDHLRAALAEATIKDNLTVEPVAYVTGYSKGYAIVRPVDPCLLMCVGMALYRSPPTINEMETVGHGIVVEE